MWFAGPRMRLPDWYLIAVAGTLLWLGEIVPDLVADGMSRSAAVQAGPDEPGTRS